MVVVNRKTETRIVQIESTRPERTHGVKRNERTDFGTSFFVSFKVQAANSMSTVALGWRRLDDS